jgi:hypothetical protein
VYWNQAQVKPETGADYRAIDFCCHFGRGEESGRGAVGDSSLRAK